MSHAQIYLSSWGTTIPSYPMPTARTRVGVALLNPAVGGTLYAIGGTTGSGASAAVEVYDTFGPFSPWIPSPWFTSTPLPGPRTAHAVAVVGSTIYVIGGLDDVSSTYTLSSVVAYDPSTRSWTPKAEMPTARAGLAVAVVNGLIYAVGGFNGSYLDTVEVYDPAADSWSPAPPMPTPRTDLAAAADGGVIYAIGGSDGSGVLAANESYDPSGGTWSTRAPMPTARDQLAASAALSRIFAFGGRTGPSAETAVVERYDPTSDSWSADTPLLSPRAGLGCAPAFTVLGGFATGTGVLNLNESCSAAGGGILPELKVWEATPVPADANAGDVIDYRISFSNVSAVSAFSVFITTQQDSFTNRVKLATVPGEVSVSGGFLPGFSRLWSTSLDGPWFTWTATGLTEPLYLRWVLGHVGMHQSGFIHYQAQVTAAPCGPLAASVSATMWSGAPSFLPSGPFSASITGTGNCNAPSAPGSFTALAGVLDVTLGWTPSTAGFNPVSGYEIYRSTCSDCSGLLVTTTAASATFYADGGLDPSITYFYAARAVDTLGAAGPFSATALAQPRTPVPVLQLTATAALTPGAPATGDAVVYRLVVANTGGITLTDLIVVDTMPSPAVIAATDQPSAFSPPLAASVAGGTRYVWQATGLSMSPGTALTFTLTGAIGEVCAAASLASTAYVIGADGVTDTQVFATPVGGAATPPAMSLAAFLSQIPPAPGIGDPVAYRIIVTNTGAATLSDLRITDTLASLIVGAVADQPAAFAAPVAATAGTGTRYAWSATGLAFAPGQSFTFTLTGRLGDICAAAPVGNSAYVDGGNPCAQRHVASNGTGFVLPPPTLSSSASLILSPPNPAGGDPVTYLIVIRNSGAATIDALTVSDTLPAVITAVAADQPAGFPTPGLGQVGGGTRYVWSASGLSFGPGQTFTFTLTGTVGIAAGPGSVSDTAYATAGAGCAVTSQTTNVVSFSVAGAPPSAPSGLVVASVIGTGPAGSPASVEVSWGAATPGGASLSAYLIYRASCAACGFTLVGSAPAAASLFADANAVFGAQYRYEVAAVDVAGQTGPTSMVASILTTACSTCPGAPVSVTSTTDSVRVIGGARGYVNPSLGEQATILVKGTMPGLTPIEIQIFNRSGLYVRHLTSQVWEGQVVAIQWDLRDSFGQIVPAGIYPILVTTPYFTATDKIAVLH